MTCILKLYPLTLLYLFIVPGVRVCVCVCVCMCVCVNSLGFSLYIIDNHVNCE